MRGLGTIINVAFLIFGGLCGLLFGKRLSERIRDTLLSINAVAIMILAIGGVMQNMLSLIMDKPLNHYQQKFFRGGVQGWNGKKKN